MRLPFALPAALLVAMSTAHAAPRTDFTAKLAKVKPGMTADEVKKLLGAPDDIVTEADPGGITAARTVEVWRYGARGRLAFGTLGTVHIQADRKVQYVFGGKGKPFTGLPEAELRRLLELIDAVPSYNDVLEPLALVRAVNALHPLGKDRALDVVDEYLRVSSSFDDPGREGVFLVMRVLFDADPMPVMMVGAPNVQPGKDPKALPRFPLVIVDDVPLKLVGGYALGGMAQQPEDDVKAFRKVGKLRARALVPTATLDSIDKYIEGPLAKAIPVDDHLRVALYDQALRFFGTVHRPADMTVDAWFTHAKDIANRWKTTRGAVAKLGATWNAKTQQLELPGGKTLPPPSTFQRVWWDLGLAGATKSRLTFERKSDRVVDVELRLELAAGGRVKMDRVRIVDEKTSKELATLDIQPMSAPVSSTNGSVMGSRLDLPRGTAIRVELASGARGPVLTP